MRVLRRPSLEEEEKDDDDDDFRMSMKPLPEDTPEKIVTSPGRQEVFARINDKRCVTFNCLHKEIVCSNREISIAKML